jgi:plasmid maintenance system antidote protein VapI
MPMKNPAHPGGFVLRQCIEPLGLTITQAATALGVRDHFSTRRL